MSRIEQGSDGQRRLAELLVDLELEPAELVSALRDSREAVVGDDAALDRDTARAELRFLEAMAVRRRLDERFHESLERARAAARGSEFASLSVAERGSAAALFDLAELGARARVASDVGLAVAVEAEIEARVESIDEVDDALREEARERYAALSTDTDDLDLESRIALLGAIERLLVAIGTRVSDRAMIRLGRRLGRLRCDRVLQSRLERVLTPRGAALLENTSLLLLFVVLVLLIVDAATELPVAVATRLQFVDASVCVFFIAEFLFKLSLSPARMSWFLRNAITDLLPAIPAALYFAVPVAGAEETVALRTLRLLRVTWFARYVHAMRPFLRLFRLLLFMARGLDALVRRFEPLLNRNLVFFEEAVMPRAPRTNDDVDTRTLAFRALRREHVVLSDLPTVAAQGPLVDRADRLAVRFDSLPPEARSQTSYATRGIARDVAIEHAIEELNALRPEELGTRLPRNDILAIDRVVRILNAPIVRSLPILRWFRSRRLAAAPEQRVVQLGRRVAAVFEKWRERALYLADLQGVVTGPQILDRLATAMVKASFRPARNLILFGLFFLLVRLLFGADSTVGQFLQRFVATPVLILGSACAIVLGLGFWLKRLAGEAADQFKLTSEASFIGLLELTKRRSQDDDLEFLAHRVFRWECDAWAAAASIGNWLRAARTGICNDALVAPAGLEDEVYRVSLLYLHFLDGAVLHDTDVTTNEQLLANLSLTNVRTVFLRHGKRERRRLRRISLQNGPLLGGPYVWFRCITESIAVETAKRVTDYNRNCLSLRQREVATREQRQRFAAWLRKRVRREAGRLEHVELPSRGESFTTTEFNALDFLSTDEIRERHIERVFGRHVVRLVRAERRAMIRELFGTKPLHLEPRSERTLNVWAFYWRRLSGGRVFLAPLHALGLVVRGIRRAIAKTREIVREIVVPERAVAGRVSGTAPFAVALRKIHRMKAPALIEAMRLRAQFDPAYCGAPAGWSTESRFDETAEFERDLEFLGLPERGRKEIREIAARNRRRVEELHTFVRASALRFDESDPGLRRCGERAVTVSFLTDAGAVRTLARAELWLEESLVSMEARASRLPRCGIRRAFAWIGRGLGPHPIDLWLDGRVGQRSVSRRGRANFKRAWHAGDRALRRIVSAWLDLPPGVAPRDAALERIRAAFLTRDEVSRELTALRTIQSLSVLDVRNYRRLVFDLGGYADDGESRAAAETLP